MTMIDNGRSGMTLGPGRYDDLCTYVREQAGVINEGGVIVIVLGGERGDGFSCQADAPTTLTLPHILQRIADEIRDDPVFPRMDIMAQSR
jgi:hypothetical protein